jgi:Domain of unknown function (DUF6456)
MAGILAAPGFGSNRMSGLTEQEILREGRRILRLIAPAGARLVRQQDGRWTPVLRGNLGSRRLRLLPELIEAFCARGWLAEGSGGDLVLSGSGRTWLAAELAGIDTQAAQHMTLRLGLVQTESGAPAVVTVNEAESPLAWLKERGSITDVQFEAGERLRRDYTIARLEPRLAIDLAAPKVQGGLGPLNPAVMPDAVLAAKQRFGRALKAAGPGLSDLLFDVCCALKSVGAIETEKGWPRRSAKIVLGLALDRLAEHYGLSPPPARGRFRSWSAERADAADG